MLDPLRPDDLDTLLAETNALYDGNSRLHAERICQNNAAAAMQVIVTLALTNTNDKLRLEASKYLIERNLGRVGNEANGKVDPLGELYEEMLALNGESSDY